METIAGAGYTLKANAFGFKITTDSPALAQKIGAVMVFARCPYQFDIEPENVYRIEVARDFMNECRAALMNLGNYTISVK